MAIHLNTIYKCLYTSSVKASVQFGIAVDKPLKSAALLVCVCAKVFGCIEMMTKVLITIQN